MLYAIQNSGRQLPAVVLLHGYGADERDLMGIAPVFGEDRRVISIRAPRPLDWGGFSWFDIEPTQEGLRLNLEQAQESQSVLLDTLSQLELERFVLAGFSQGAMMALGLLSTKPESVAGVIAMSGARLPIWNLTAHVEAPILFTHGRQDPVVEFARGEQAHADFESVSRDMTFYAFDGGHTIDDGCLECIQEWFAARFESAV